MNNAVKALEDIMPSAGEVLLESLNLVDQMAKCEEALRPFGKEQKAQFGSLPKYVAHRLNVLREATPANFDINYPCVSSILANGQSDDEGMRRLHDGLYKVGQFANRARELKFAVKLEEDESFLHELAKKAAGDLAIFVISQYRLDMLESGVYLSVAEYCDRVGETPSVLYGEMLTLLSNLDEHPYGYERVSKYQKELLDIDPVFVAECEEQSFPLTTDMCEKIINGEMSVDAARGFLLDFMKQKEETDVDGMTPANMIEQLHLS